VSDAPEERSVSHAKTVDLGHSQNALNRAQKLKEAFELAKAQPETQEQQKTQQDGKTEQQAHAPQPQLDLKPPDGDIRREVDKQVNDEKLTKLQERAKALQEACERDFQLQKEKELQPQLHLHRGR
jgi:hypothetical protein